MQLGNPSSFDPSIHNDCLAILARHAEMIEDTLVPDYLSVLRLAPALEIIGRATSKMFNRRYPVFTKGDDHLVRHTWNVLESAVKNQDPLVSKQTGFLWDVMTSLEP